MRIDLFAHFTTQEFRQAYLSTPLGAKGRRLDPWKSMYHDTAAVDANAFACGFNVFGPDHVVFATDYPYGRNKGEYVLESRRRFVDGAHIDAEARQKIYEDNARQLLHLG